MVTPRKLRAIGRYLENLNPKINEIIRILEADYGGRDENGEEDETLRHLYSIAGLVSEAGFECELKAKAKEGT